jgi:hypothetical protein
MRIAGCVVLASCVHAAPPPARVRADRALPSDVELARATACERQTGEQRRMIALGDAQLGGAWQRKLDGRAVEMLSDLSMAWDAVVPLYLHGSAPFDDAQLARLRDVGANVVVSAGAVLSIEAPLSRLACFGDLEFVVEIAGHERMHPT